MLAIRGLVTLGDDVETLIFDEVDTGIGGVTAAALGERLRRLAERRQVLCITHLPQVAARGRQHLVVRKGRSGAVSVERVDGEARVEEIARMAGGKTVGEATRRHARELLRAAGNPA